MNEVRIRAANPADAQEIARVHVEAWRESYRALVPEHVIEALSVDRNTGMWTAILAGGVSSVVHVVERLDIAADGVELVGFGSARDARSPALGASGEITAIYLLESFKRRGIGRMLLKGLLGALAERSHRSAGLWALVDNHGTRRFYEALGGRPGAPRLVTDGPADMYEIAYIWDDLSGFARPSE